MSELYHYGIMGMKWGVRRYQNPDGTLTPAGRKRYGDKSPYEVKTNDNVKVKLKDILKSSYIRRGRDFTQSQNIQQQMNQRFTDWSMQEATRASINAANQAASLGISGGTNPFMFGMM